MQAMNNDEANSLIGKTLGQFRIVAKIGSGGMATVFKAYQPTLDRYVAIKVALHARDPIFVKRFVLEAKSVARLQHANIVTIHEFGESAQDNITYIVMEYVDGGTLKDRLRGGHPLPVPEAVDFIMQAAEGLECAHRNGIIHRDVKPANMLIRKDGHLLLSDFGISKILEGTTNLTRAGTSIGTPQYMSPEQVMGRDVDRRSDIYSLGIVFFHCLTGHVPFTGDNPVSITIKQLNEPLPVQQLQALGIPAPVEQVVVKMTAKQPQERYQTMEAVVAALKGILSAYSWPASGPLPNLSAPSASLPYNLAPPSREQDAQQQGVTVTCFRCGTANPSSRLFCTTCGYDLSDKPPTPDMFLGPNGRPMLARLTIQNGPMAGRSYLFHQVVTTIGRTNGNNLIISGRTVSRRHARLWFDNGQWFLEDLQSVNGTMVNNVRLTQQQPKALSDGDIINFGDEVVLFNIAYN